MLWIELLTSLSEILGGPAPISKAFVLAALDRLEFRFALHLGNPNRNVRKRWFTGVTHSQPLYVAVVDDPDLPCDGDVPDAHLAAQVFGFLRVWNPRTPLALAEVGADDAGYGTGILTLAVVAWLKPHPRCKRLDDKGRGVCEELPFNHALWCTETAPDGREGVGFDALKVQLEAAGVNYQQWVRDWGTRNFDLVCVKHIVGGINVAPDPDTPGGLLQTISLTGYQKEQTQN